MPSGWSEHTSTKVRPDEIENESQKGKPMSTLKYQEVTMADCLSQDAMMIPFRTSFEALREKINRLERRGVCWKDAEAAHQEIEELILKLDCFIIKKVALHHRIRAAEEASPTS
jgi:hypothetical protein